MLLASNQAHPQQQKLSEEIEKPLKVNPITFEKHSFLWPLSKTTVSLYEFFKKSKDYNQIQNSRINEDTNI